MGLLCNIFTVAAQNNAIQELLDFEKTPLLHKDENPADVISKNIFVQISTSKNKVYAGEPFLVTYKLYTALHSESSIKQQPFFSGCSVKELDNDITPFFENVNGKKYHVFIIRNLALTPLQAGTLQLGIASINNIVRFEDADNPYSIKEYTATVSNEPVRINVLNLPQQEKPANFSGAIGTFTIRAGADTQQLPAGENAHLRITIQGSGNMDDISLPSIQWPAGTEHFEGTDSQYNTQNMPLFGNKIFDIPFIGSVPGKVTIPPVFFSYFNTEKNKYETIHTDSVQIKFVQPVSSSQIISHNTHNGVSNTRYIWIVPAIGITVLAIVWLVAMKKKNSAGKALPQANKIVQNELPQAPPLAAFAIEKQKINIAEELKILATVTELNAFFAFSKAILTQAIQEKCETAETSETLLLRSLYHITQNEILVAHSQAFYKNCNMALYASAIQHHERDEIYEQLSKIILQLHDNDYSV